MWVYEKKLEIPVRVSIPDVRMAARLITQYGGPDFMVFHFVLCRLWSPSGPL